MASDIDKLLRAVFRDEVAESLDELARVIEFLRTRPDDKERQDSLATSFRIAHNVKGAARAAGVELAEDVMHAVEALFADWRASSQPPADEALDVVVEAISVVQQAAEGKEVSSGVSGVLERIAGVRTGATNEDTSAETQETPRKEPLAEGPAPTEDRVGTVRVATSRLDTLMGHTGELLASHARLKLRQGMLDELAESLDELLRKLELERNGFASNFKRRLTHLVQLNHNDLRDFGHLARDVNDAVRRVRMLPLSGEAPRWRRIVRDCSRELSKHVLLDIEVGDTELDKSVVDDLRDPLMHLLRNAMDHGIETGDVRVGSGKPESGRISIRATVHGSMAHIDVSDDGRGMNTETIAAIAVSRGGISQEQIERMSSAQIHDLVFMPGFSTLKQATRLSGRGFGLDAVRKRVEALGGSVSVAATPRLGGTTIGLSLPINVVSIAGLLVRVGQTTCVLPIDYVDRCIRVETSATMQSGGTTAIRQEGQQPVHLRWLASLVGEPRTSDPSKLTVVRVSRGGATLGLVVNEVLGEGEFVSKSLPWNLRQIADVTGAVILGDGTLGIVLDVAHLFQDADGNEGLANDAIPMVSNKRVAHLLVVDDSLTSRTLERNLLVAAGYEVSVAQDGAEAWDLLQGKEFDMVVADVQMPNVDGLELTRRIRRSPKHKDLPIILVSSLGEPSDLELGAAAGANEYIVKSRFDQRHLLEAVVRLL